jgi:hypothetical protein
MANDNKQTNTGDLSVNDVKDFAECEEVVFNDDEHLHHYPLLVCKTPEERKAIEKKLLRKLDWVMLPTVTLMLLMGCVRRNTAQSCSD